MKSKKKIFIYGIPISIANGVLYYAVAAAGADNLQNLFHFTDNFLLYLIGIGSAICYGMFTYKLIEHLTLKPKNLFSWLLVILSPFAACNFFTAGIEGASILGVSNFGSIIFIGLILFFFRTINYIDGAVKFPARLIETQINFREILGNRDYKHIICLIITTYGTIGYSLSTTDSIYSAAITIGKILNFKNDNNLSVIAYVSSGIGALVGIPMIFYWIQRGIMQLTNSGVSDINGINRDPTDIYTFVGLLASLPVILGCLGAASSSSEHVFGRFGLFAEGVRVSSSLIYGICAGIPGLSTLFRVISNVYVLKFDQFKCN